MMLGMPPRLIRNREVLQLRSSACHRLLYELPADTSYDLLAESGMEQAGEINGCDDRRTAEYAVLFH
jgi:hypothetical protein